MMPMESQSTTPPHEQPSFAKGLSVAVVGARRVRQGTGPYLALQAAQAGAEVVGVLGTRPSTARKAVEWLAERGLRTQGFFDHEQMLEELHPDVVLIASPLGTHRAWLHTALQVRAHVYCEKPLVAASAAIAKRILEKFAASNLVLAENCQWPQVLSAFQRLHPQIDFSQAQRFRMLMAPPLRGLTRWHETLSHPLSLIQQIAPGPAELQQVQFLELSPDAADTRLRFQYVTLNRSLDCEIVLEDIGTFPRPAEFAIDDALCRRQVEGEAYSISFVDGNAGCTPVSIGDPMALSLRNFLSRVLSARQHHSAPLDEPLLRRQVLLEQLLEIYRATAHH